MTPGNEQATNLLNNTATTSKSKAVVANSISLDPKNPIPLDYGADTFQVVLGKRYIPFLGNEDRMPNVFWESRLLSTTQNACISTIAQSCVGEGLQVTNVELAKVDPEFFLWASEINTEGQSLNELCRTAIDALLTDGNSWPEIVKGKFGGKAFVKAYLHTTMICRLSNPDDKTGKITSVVKSQQLAKPRNGMLTARSLKAVTIPLYSSNSLDQKAVWLDTEKDGFLHTMIHLKNEIPGVPYYGLPKSVASLRYQIIEGKAAQYNIDQFDNNMVLSALLIFKSAMSETEAAEAAKEIIKTHTGQGKQGRVGVVSSEGGIDDFTYQPLDTQRDGSFDTLDKRVEQKIITSHGWDAVLAGISRDSAFGNGSQYVRAVYDIKKAMVLKPQAQYIIDKLIKPLVAIAADEMNKPEWKKYAFEFKYALPFSLISDIEVNNVLTKDEGRKILGEPPMEDATLGKQIIGTRITETFNSPKPIE
jgi:hypothetical protein